MTSVPPVLVPIFNDVDFNQDNRPELLHQLNTKWQTIRTDSASIYPELQQDPTLSPTTPEDQEALLKRYLLAEEFDVDKAAIRLLATLKFRKQFNFLQFYEPGSGAKVLSNALNPGAEAYFVDSCSIDKTGAPILIGKLLLTSNDNLHPWSHLRAALFICERLQSKCLYPIQQASYILDVGPCDSGMVGTYGPLGGDKKSKQYNKYNRVKEEDANNDIRQFITSDASQNITKEEIDAIVREYGKMSPGLTVLKIAMKVLQEHFPESLRRVVFAHSGLSFWLLFKVFSLWAQPRTRKKFQFIGNGWKDYPMSSLLTWIDVDQIYQEFGGNGMTMGGDAFVKRAVEMYDKETGAMDVNDGKKFGGGENKVQGEVKEQKEEKVEVKTTVKVTEKKEITKTRCISVHIEDTCVDEDGHKTISV